MNSGKVGIHQHAVYLWIIIMLILVSKPVGVAYSEKKDNLIIKLDRATPLITVPPQANSTPL